MQFTPSRGGGINKRSSVPPPINGRRNLGGPLCGGPSVTGHGISYIPSAAIAINPKTGVWPPEVGRGNWLSFSVPCIMHYNSSAFREEAYGQAIGGVGRTVRAASGVVAEGDSRGDVARGSVVLLRRPCTRKGCRRCAAGERHPATYLGYRQAGKLPLAVSSGEADSPREGMGEQLPGDGALLAEVSETNVGILRLWAKQMSQKKSLPRGFVLRSIREGGSRKKG